MKTQILGNKYIRILVISLILINQSIQAQSNIESQLLNGDFEKGELSWVLLKCNIKKDTIQDRSTVSISPGGILSQTIELKKNDKYAIQIDAKSLKGAAHIDVLISSVKNGREANPKFKNRIFFNESLTQSSFSFNSKDSIKVSFINNSSKSVEINRIQLLVVEDSKFIGFQDWESEPTNYDYNFRKVAYTGSSKSKTLNSANSNFLEEGFETDLASWVVWGPEVSLSKEKYAGENSATINSSQAKWVGFNRIVGIPGTSENISFQAAIKTNGIKQGNQPWEKFVFKVVYQDEAGNILQEIPIVELIGTKEWKVYSKTLSRPKNATKVDVVFALGNCTGQAFVDNVKVGEFEVDLSDQPTELLNGDFEEGLDSWNSWGAQAIVEDSTNCIMIKNDDFKWSGCHQEFSVNKNLKYLQLSGKFKLEKVVGGQNGWEKAVCKAEFLNKTGTVIGEQYLISLVGSSDWTTVAKTFKVPENCKSIKITIALGNAIGKLWADKIEISSGEEDQYVLERTKLINPSFENGLDGWPDYAGTITNIAHTGNNAVVISNFTQKREWLVRRQSIVIPKGSKNFKLKAWVKLDKAEEMKNGWEGARIYVSYLDKNGDAIPQSDAGVFRGDGTTEWMFVEQDLMIPGNAYELTINLALCNSFGSILVDDVELVFESESSLLSDIKPGWYPMKFNNDLYSGHYVDWSVLLDAPAGKHGFLKVVNGQNIFEDGTSAKFFGVNMGAEFCFLPKDKVDSLVKRFSKIGINLVRMHHMDAGWSVRNIFGPGDGTSTRKLDPIRLEQFDYLVASLKKAGIYIYLDILVHRQFKPGDGVQNPPLENGGKQVAIFDEKIIELQKEYIDQLFSHVNVYTKLTYGNDPAFIGSEIVNETWIGGHWSGEFLSKYYSDKLDQKYEQSPYYKGKDRAKFKHISKELQAFAFLDVINSNSDAESTLRFLHAEEGKYVQDMLSYIRSKNVKYPLAYTNMPFSFTSLLKNKAKGDIIINNTYWAHPWDFSIGVLSPLVKASMLQKVNTSLIVENAAYTIHKKPFFITEWNHCYPNPHRAEALPMMAAYGSFQGWDMAQFVWSDNTMGSSAIQSFSIAQDPVSIAQWVVAAPLFHRGYVKKSNGSYVHSLSNDKIFSLPNQDRFIAENYYIPYVTKYSNSFELTKDSGDLTQLKKYVNLEKKIFTSDTEELKVDGSKKLFSINTEKIQGAVGFYRGDNVALPSVEITLKNEYASAFLLSQDNLPLTTSRRMYLVVVTNVEMKGQSWDENISEDWKKDGNGKLKNAGKFPLIAEYAVGTIKLNRKIEPQKLTIYQLSPEGARIKKIPYEIVGSSVKIEFTDIDSFVLEIISE